MDDIVDILQRAIKEKKLSLNDRGTVSLENIRCDDDVRDSGLVFEAEENETFCGSGALARDDATGDANSAAIGYVCEVARAKDSQGIQFLAAISHRVRADGHAGAPEICKESFFRCHDLERGGFVIGFYCLQQGTGALSGAFYLPEGVTAMTGMGGVEEVQRSDFRKLDEFVLLKFGNTKDKVVDGSERLLVACANDRAPGGFVKTADVTKANAQREGPSPSGRGWDIKRCGAG
jgi:hypothetical protein